MKVRYVGLTVGFVVDIAYLITGTVAVSYQIYEYLIIAGH